MNRIQLVLAAVLLLATVGITPTRAQEKPLSVAPVLATKTVFAEGFGEAQGVAINGEEIFVTDYKTGEVVRLAKDGKKLGTLATG